MENTELRIGNIVNDDESHLIITAENIEWACIVAEESLTGVPLTKEWLTKFGFEWMPEAEYTHGAMSKDGIQVWVKNGFVIEKPSIKYNLLYIHQLQNLYFALTGEEITVKY